MLVCRFKLPSVAGRRTLRVLLEVLERGAGYKAAERMRDEREPPKLLR